MWYSYAHQCIQRQSHNKQLHRSVADAASDQRAERGRPDSAPEEGLRPGGGHSRLRKGAVNAVHALVRSGRLCRAHRNFLIHMFTLCRLRGMAVPPHASLPPHGFFREFERAGRHGWGQVLGPERDQGQVVLLAAGCLSCAPPAAPHGGPNVAQDRQETDRQKQQQTDSPSII